MMEIWYQIPDQSGEALMSTTLKREKEQVRQAKAAA
jgi:hypothetical protein